MATEQTGSHEEIRRRFEETLGELRQGMVQMGGMVTENTRRAGEAMLEGRMELVEQVSDADEEINQLYEALERKTFETLARQQPVAGDLRFLVSATRILYELERSGDLAVNCVNALKRMDGFPESALLKGLLGKIVTDASALFARSIDVIADMDAEAGEKLDHEDDVIDDDVSAFYAEVGREAEQWGLETAIELSRIGRYLERIADHGVNIGNNIYYVVTGAFPSDMRDPGGN